MIKERTKYLKLRASKPTKFAINGKLVRNRKSQS